MIQRLSHCTVWVLNQDEAYEFYVNKLGFKVNTDAKMENGFRWLTVTPPAQPDLEIVLMPVESGPMMDEETRDALRALVKKGVLGAGVFATADCFKTYDELKAKGVEFSQAPVERFYGVEALMKDNSGNWFSVSSPAPKSAESKA
jgi:catechol 2,3-dioxygenase-like lactoylglutathione lyase family enzyme